MPSPLTKSGKPDKRYKPKNNTPSLPEVINKLIPETTELTIEEKLILELYKGVNPYNAAINAGYSQSMADSGIYTKLKKPTFKKAFKEFAVNHNVLLLAKVAQIDEAILDKLSESNDLLDDYQKVKDVPKRIQQVAGILHDTIPMQRTVPLQVQVNVGVMLDQDTKPEAIDVTPLDDKE